MGRVDPNDTAREFGLIAQIGGGSGDWLALHPSPRWGNDTIS